MSERQRQVSGLTRKLVAEGIIEEASAVELDQEAKSANLPFVAYLVNEKGISAEKIATAAADEFTTPILDLDAFDTSALPEGIVSNELIRKNHAVPLFQRGNRLFVAVSDPTNQQALSDIQFQTGIATEEVLVREDQLSKFIQAHLVVDESSVFEGLDDDIDLDLETVDTTEEDEEATDSGIDDTPVVRFINKMLLDAIKLGSSDLHFEPFEKSYKVRFRTDGILHQVATPPITLAPRIAARLKVMSQMDISERRVPQDGRIKLKVSKTKSIVSPDFPNGWRD